MNKHVHKAGGDRKKKAKIKEQAKASAAARVSAGLQPL